MTKFGQVSAFDASTGMATIVYARPDACEKCGACGTKTHQGSISLKADCAQGDWVRVELPDGQFLKATSIAYLVPLCGFVLGLMLGYFLSGKNELIAFFGAMGGLALSLVPLMLADKRLSRRPEWSPRVTAVYKTKPELAHLGCNGAGGQAG